MTRTRFQSAALLLALSFAGAIADAAPADLLAGYVATARGTQPAFAPSAARGREFFTSRHGSDWSCSTCHTQDPATEGRHATTQRAIAPLSPLANPRRFADEARVEKWFGRNCRDVVGRACTAAEKADVLAWLAGAR